MLHKMETAMQLGWKQRVIARDRLGVLGVVDSMLHYVHRNREAY